MSQSGETLRTEPTNQQQPKGKPSLAYILSEISIGHCTYDRPLPDPFLTDPFPGMMGTLIGAY